MNPYSTDMNTFKQLTIDNQVADITKDSKEFKAEVLAKTQQARSLLTQRLGELDQSYKTTQGAKLAGTEGVSRMFKKLTDMFNDPDLAKIKTQMDELNKLKKELDDLEKDLNLTNNEDVFQVVNIYDYSQIKFKELNTKLASSQDEAIKEGVKLDTKRQERQGISQKVDHIKHDQSLTISTKFDPEQQKKINRIFKNSEIQRAKRKYDKKDTEDNERAGIGIMRPKVLKAFVETDETIKVMLESKARMSSIEMNPSHQLALAQLNISKLQKKVEPGASNVKREENLPQAFKDRWSNDLKKQNDHLTRLSKRKSFNNGKASETVKQKNAKDLNSAFIAIDKLADEYEIFKAQYQKAQNLLEKVMDAAAGQDSKTIQNFTTKIENAKTLEELKKLIRELEDAFPHLLSMAMPQILSNSDKSLLDIGTAAANLKDDKDGKKKDALIKNKEMLEARVQNIRNEIQSSDYKTNPASRKKIDEACDKLQLDIIKLKKEYGI